MSTTLTRTDTTTARERTRTRRRCLALSRTAATLAVTALILTACSTSDTPTEAAPQSGPTSCPSAPPTVPAPDGATTDLKTKPTITVPKTAPPAALQVADIVTGEGPAACTGSNLTVRYVGVTYADGKQFDASWDKNMDFPFTLGQGNVIQGWDQGLVGMRVGGRRELTIPSDLGYGPGGNGAIPGDAALVFVVDLVQVA